MKAPRLALLTCGLLVTTPTSAQTIYTFTTAGAAGTTGPDQAMIDAEYASTNLAGQVTSTGGIQFWTVPTTGSYQIEGYGGQGYGPFGGRGAHISGEFNLTAGTTLKILVGQQGAPYLDFPQTTYNNQFGGGGGSFITFTDNTPLVVAGGGGGSHATGFLAGADGQISESGAAGSLGSTIGAGGTAGSGGLQATSADGGGGLLGNGTGTAAGQAFVNGGLGGGQQGIGGFGGGGGTSSWNNYRGGGGGGYSGGGGGNNGANCCAAGGGGGSYNGGTNPVNLAGVQLGDGLVRITLLILPPTFVKAFSPDTIIAGGVSTLSFSLDNAASMMSATALDFTDNLPAGVLVATPANSSNSCGGTLTATAGTGVISLTGGSLAAGANCTITVDVTAAAAGTYVNVTGDLTSNAGSSGTATDTLSVTVPPSFSKNFASATAAVGDTVTLSFLIDNTANPVDATSLALVDALPAGMLVATPDNASTSCGGTVTATSGTGTISFTGGTATAGTSCTVSADVTAANPGTYNNVSGDLTSSLGNSGTASDSLAVTTTPSFTKSFATATAAAGAPVTLSFVIDNSVNPLPATTLDFTDNLPAGMLVATTANLGNSCGGTATAVPGSGSISLTGGSVPAGSSCTVTVNVSAANPGSYTNVSGNLTSSLGDSGTASATLAVTTAPAFTKSFATADVTAGDVVMLSFLIDNGVNPVSADALAFTDNLPAGMVVANPANASNGCGGTLTALPGASTVSLAGGSVAALATCGINVDVQISSALPTSILTNDAGTLGSTLGSSAASATATLAVNSAVAVPGLSGRSLLLLTLLLSLVGALTIRRSTSG